MGKNSKQLAAFVCNTPYQIMNCISMVMKNTEGTAGNSDLFLISRFSGARKIYERIRELHIFNNVFYVEPLQYDKRLLSRLWIRSIPFRVFSFDDRSFLSKCYDRIFIGDMCEFSVDMIRKNRHAGLYLYDDGTQSYSGNFILDNYKGRKQKIDKIFHTGRYALKFRKLYLNCPGFCRTTIETTVAKIPEPDKSTISLFEKVFDFNRLNSNIKDNKIIYLDMRLDEIESYNGITIEQMVDDPIRDAMLVRKHPRSNEKFTGLNVDDRPNMWELECISNIQDSHILVGFCSTAQITPKLIGNREPWVVFLYRIMSENSGDEAKKRDSIAERLREVYVNKERILVPDTIDEFQQVMKKLIADSTGG